MERELPRVEPRSSSWDQREEFLLLPGDGLILVSGEGRLLFFDSRARLLLGPASKDCCGEPLEAIWPELAELLEHFTVTVREKGPVDTQANYAGRPRAVRLFRSDDGMGVVLLGDRPELACAAAEQLLMHQRILENVRDAVLVTTAEPIGSPGPVIVYANAAAQRQTGYGINELLGRSPRLLQGPNTDPKARQHFRDAMAHWQPLREVLLNYRKNGSTFWVEIDIAPLADRDGWYTYWAAIQRECRGPHR